MTKKDWFECPNCKFPALKPQFQEVLEVCGACPMCYHVVLPEIAPDREMRGVGGLAV